MPIHKELNHRFFSTWSPEMAYVLGYFAADGSMIRNKRGAHFIEFTSTDRTLLAQVRVLVCSDHRIAVRARGSAKQKTQYRIQFGSQRWFLALERLGFVQAKSNVLALPRIPKRYQPDFVRGYFDGDGMVHFSTYYPKDRPKGKIVFMTSFTSGSKQFLVALKKLLVTRDLKGGSLFEKHRGFTLSYSSRDSVALYRFMYHTSRVSAFLPRKRRIFELAMRRLGYQMRL